MCSSSNPRRRAQARPHTPPAQRAPASPAPRGASQLSPLPQPAHLSAPSTQLARAADHQAPNSPQALISKGGAADLSTPTAAWRQRKQSTLACPSPFARCPLPSALPPAPRSKLRSRLPSPHRVGSEQGEESVARGRALGPPDTPSRPARSSTRCSRSLVRCPQREDRGGEKRRPWAPRPNCRAGLPLAPRRAGSEPYQPVAGRKWPDPSRGQG